MGTPTDTLPTLEQIDTWERQSEGGREMVWKIRFVRLSRLLRAQQDTDGACPNCKHSLDDRIALTRAQVAESARR
jgi:hypothetical protein